MANTDREFQPSHVLPKRIIILWHDGFEFISGSYLEKASGG